MRSQGLLHSVSFRSCKTLKLVNLQFVNSKLQRGQQSWSARDWLLLPIIKWYWTRKTQCTCQVIIEICRKRSMACADFAHIGQEVKVHFHCFKMFQILVRVRQAILLDMRSWWAPSVCRSDFKMWSDKLHKWYDAPFSNSSIEQVCLWSAKASMQHHNTAQTDQWV